MDARQTAGGRAGPTAAGRAPVVIPAAIPDRDFDTLKRAVETLDRSSLASRLNSVIGRQIDVAAQIVPAPVLSMVNGATVRALRIALRAAVRSLRTNRSAVTAHPRLHVAAAALSGAAGGAFGLAALPIELPVSTTIMLRGIAEIARAEGEALDDPETLLACLEVFALGSGSENGPAGESGYLATRSLLAKSVTEAARYVLQRGVADEAAPAIVRLLSQITARFGSAVGQKAITQAVPVIGAVTGAAINAAFADHFQDVARAHFAVRRLERQHGRELIQRLFADLRAKTIEATPPRSELVSS